MPSLREAKDMSKPLAWSHSALDSFENCPKQYYETKVEKRWPFVESAEMRYGKEVHKHFENYLVYGTALPSDLEMHLEFLQWFKGLPGDLKGEERIALDTELRQCAYFSKTQQVWYRGQIDARKRNGAHTYILDHKTGKVKNDFSQLKGFAMFEFLTNPQCQEVRAEFYWTQIRASNGEVYTRAQLPQLIGEFTPRLHRFADAFLTGVFPPKQSGLCNGWCLVTDCEFWREKRKRP